MTLRYTTYHMLGGIHPPERKRLSNKVAIRPAPLPKTLVLPLSQHIGQEATPTVRVGDRVLRGQCIASGNSALSAPVHASSSGIVTAIREHPTVHPSAIPAPCIFIETDGNDTWHPNAQPRPAVTDFHEHSAEQLRQRVEAAGIVGLGGAGFPTALKATDKKTISTLILNAVECEPYITADDLSLRERTSAILIGCHWLAQITGATKVLIGIEDNKPEAITFLKKALKQHVTQHGSFVRFEIIVVPTKYPSGGEKQLIQLLTGMEVPRGKLPADLGFICVNVGTSYAVYEALSCHTPLTSRVTTITGQAIPAKTRGNYEVRLGTKVKDLFQALEVDWAGVDRLVHGGPMMGYTLQSAEAPIVKVSNCLLAAPFSELPEPKPEQPCIRCGQCADVCPAALLPQQLYWHAKAKDEAGLMREHLMDCIECGACAYVCPSHIPLVQYYRFGKGRIRQHAQEKQKSDQARIRFENRQARIEKEQAQREAKRQARLKKTQQHAKTATNETAPPEKTGRILKDDQPVTSPKPVESKKSAEDKASVEQKAPIQKGQVLDQKKQVSTQKKQVPGKPSSNKAISSSHTEQLKTLPTASAAKLLPTKKNTAKKHTEGKALTGTPQPSTDSAPKADIDEEALLTLKNSYLKAKKRWQDAQKALNHKEKHLKKNANGHTEQTPEIKKIRKKVDALQLQADALESQWLMMKSKNTQDAASIANKDTSHPVDHSSNPKETP